MDVTTTTDNCRYCLMCRHVCPVGHLTHLETLTPHGWGLTIASVRRGLLSWNAETVNILYSCADCGACRAHCVNDQPLPDAISEARAGVVQMGSAPDAVYELETMLEEWGNPYRKEKAWGTPAPGVDAIFVGDEAHYLWPEGLDAAKKVLQVLAVEPVEVGAGRSSGYLASSLGLPQAARVLAQDTLDDLAAAGARRLFLLSAGDYYTFNQMFSERLGVPWPEEVELIEVATFIDDRMQAGMIHFNPSRDETACAYIDPSHAVRVPGREIAPRRLLEGVFPGRMRELFWRRERAHPAGSTALQFTQPHIAEMLTRARLEDALRSQAEVLICEDPGTLAQLNLYAGEYGLKIRGLYEVLSEHMDGY